MTEGRREERPGPDDPWANLARIEASLRADAQAFGLPVPDELPPPLLGGPPLGGPPSGGPMLSGSPARDALRRDRSRVRGAAEPEILSELAGGDPGTGARDAGTSHPGTRRGARAVERRGEARADDAPAVLDEGRRQLTIGPGRRPTAGATRVPPLPPPPPVAAAPRALRLTDVPDEDAAPPAPAPPPLGVVGDGAVGGVADAGPVPMSVPPLSVPPMPGPLTISPPTIAAPTIAAPVVSAPPRPPEPEPTPIRPERGAPDLDFDRVLSESSPARRGRFRLGARRRGAAPRRPAKPPGSATGHPNQPRLTGVLDGRRAPVLAAGLVICLVLVGVGYGINTWSDPRPSTVVARTESASQLSGGAPEPVASVEATLPQVQPTRSTAAQARKVKLGVFRGTDPPAVGSFGRWLGRDPDVVIDFSARDTWEHIANPDYMIHEWRNSGYRVVYSTALLPESGGATIAAGSRGAYDTYYKRLARNLVAGGEGDAIIRLGWEFNLATSKWSTANTRQFIAYWRHVVTAMRSVPGQEFEFDWNPNIGATAYDATRYWPGNAYVDYVGADVYDVSWQENTYPYPSSCNAACRLARQQTVWQRLFNGPHGLAFWAGFARSKGKPMSLPEWGLWERPDGHGGGENPYFIEQMWRFIADPSNNVAYQAYFETAAEDGNHRMMTTLTTSGKHYRKLFGR